MSCLTWFIHLLLMELLKILTEFRKFMKLSILTLVFILIQLQQPFQQ